MAKFTGSLEDFNRYFGGFCRNKVRQITTRSRQSRNGVCEHCSRKAELQSAHKIGFERKKIIGDVFTKLYRNGIELNEFSEAFIDAHMPIEEHFLFLCQKCHKKYDDSAKALSAPSRAPKLSSGRRLKRVFPKQIAQDCAREYLYNTDTSFRKIETNILKIESPARGGGFIAKEIINGQGITARQKGILSRSSISDEIKDAPNAKYKEVLIEIKKQQSWRP